MRQSSRTHIASMMQCTFERSQGTWGHAIELGLVGVVRRGDARHVGAVAARVRHDGQHLALVVDVHAKVERVLIAAGGRCAVFNNAPDCKVLPCRHISLSTLQHGRHGKQRLLYVAAQAALQWAQDDIQVVDANGNACMLYLNGRQPHQKDPPQGGVLPLDVKVSHRREVCKQAAAVAGSI